MTIDPAALPYAETVPVSVRRALRKAHCVISAAAVARAVDRLAVRLSVDWQDQNPLLVAVLPHGLVLAGMLLERLVFPLQVTTVTDALTLSNDLDLHDRPVLFVHGFVDAASCDRYQQQSAELAAAAVVQIALLGPTALPEGLLTAIQDDRVDLIGSGLSIVGYGANLPGLYALQD